MKISLISLLCLAACYADPEAGAGGTTVLKDDATFWTRVLSKRKYDLSATPPPTPRPPPPVPSPTPPPEPAPTPPPVPAPTPPPVPAQLGSICGSVTEDVNGDMAGDFPLSFVILQLKDQNGNLIMETTTDGNGEYCFLELPAGCYVVMQMNLPGYVDVSDIDPAGGANTINVCIGGDDPLESTGNDFVDARPIGSIAGDVTQDINGDGTGDVPIPNTPIALEDSTGNIVATTVTGSDGTYLFSDLPQGCYVVTETNLPGFGDVSDIDPESGENVISVCIGGDDPLDSTGNDFVDELLIGSIAGDVTEDINGDGTGDDPIPNTPIALEDSSGTVVATTVTGSDGTYLFSDLPQGCYVVTETNLPGFGDVSDIDPESGENVINVCIGGDEPLDSTGNDFVDERPIGSIAGDVTEDINGDGTGDDPIPNTPIALEDSSGTVVATTLTGADGTYLFSDLPQGCYVVTETNLPGFGDVSDIDPESGENVINVCIGGDEPLDSTGNDFVDERPMGSICGSVTEDLNGDMTGDEPLSNVPIQLKGSSGTVFATTVTGTDGGYCFEGLDPGCYVVMEMNLPGFLDVSDTDPDAGPNTINACIGGDDPLDSTGNDFVDERPLGAISGNVSEDLNGDGTGDDPISSVPISLTGPDGSVQATTLTDSEGNYEFPDLMPGCYTVEETNLPGFDDVSDIDPESGVNMIEACIGVDGNPLVSTGNDFVDARPLGSICGTVLEDLNGDTTGDQPISNVSIQLKDESGTVIDETVTDADGFYKFSMLPEDCYIVMEMNLPGFVDVSDTDPDGGPNTINVCIGGEDPLDSTGNDFVDEIPPTPPPVPDPTPPPTPEPTPPPVPQPVSPPNPQPTPPPTPNPTPPPVPQPTPPPIPQPTPLPATPPPTPAPAVAPTPPPSPDTTGEPSLIPPTDDCNVMLEASCVPPESSGVENCEAIPFRTRCEDRPFVMVFKYNGGTCDQSFNIQTCDIFRCEDYGGAPIEEGEESFIVITDIKGRGIDYFSGFVPVGEEFQVADGGNDVEANMNMTIYNSDERIPENIVQTLVFHTSCSQNLFLKDKFGAIQLVIFANEEQGVVSCFANVTFTYVMDNVGGRGMAELIQLTAIAPPFGVFDLTDDVQNVNLAEGENYVVEQTIILDLTERVEYGMIATSAAESPGGFICRSQSEFSFTAGLPPLEDSSRAPSVACTTAN